MNLDPICNKYAKLTHDGLYVRIISWSTIKNQRGRKHFSPLYGTNEMCKSMIIPDYRNEPVNVKTSELTFVFNSFST